MLEILTYLSTNHSAVGDMLFYFDPTVVPEPKSPKDTEPKGKGKEKILDGEASAETRGTLRDQDVPLALFLKLLNRPLFLRSTAHLEQVK